MTISVQLLMRKWLEGTPSMTLTDSECEEGQESDRMRAQSPAQRARGYILVHRERGKETVMFRLSVPGEGCDLASDR